MPGANYYTPTNVSVQMALDNLLNIDDIGSSFTMDFYLRMYWVDPRIYLPAIFNETNPECTKEGQALIDITIHLIALTRTQIFTGIDILGYIRNQGTPLNFWLPDVGFYTVSEITLLAEGIKMLPDGLM